MTNSIHILLVEDEEILTTIIKETLEQRGFRFTIARNGVEGWEMFRNEKPDICVVDVMMPRKDGYSLVEDIRRVDEWTPVIFLTAKNQIPDVLKGLTVGGDDYMKKPFSMEELILRIHKLVRRSRTNLEEADSPQLHTSISIGKFHFKPQLLHLSFEKEIITLSQRESELLELLAQNKNRLLDRDAALLKLWGDSNPFTARSMDVYITRLRKCLNADPNIEIMNVRNKGYKLLDKGGIG
ncbi:response regulator [Flavobacterium sp. Sd200]|uniref:response regulator transcription factor n=1 Tax=Flavobacterium sp. Sd200 TaxID=2692211 RepID=UPI00136F85DA|nr:response regulator transcription factor [Flavobacterium sp. Sd200]MXN89853.1 response regulator [Flavobacterium sp. Sd200]